MTRMLIYIVLILFINISSQARADGIWNRYLNGNDLSDVIVSGNYVWAATDGGLVRWDKNTGQYRHFTRDDGLDSNDLGFLVSDPAGNIWLSYDKYRTNIARFNNDSFNTIDATNGTTDKTLRAAYFTDKGDQWFGFVTGGVIHNDGNTWTTYLPQKVIDKTPRSMVEDMNGLIWVATTDGAWTFDGDSWESYSDIDGLANNSVTDIALGPDGRIWFATINGLSVYDGTTWRQYRKSDGLINNHVNVVFIDSQSRVWAGTDYGVSRYDGTSWITFTEENDLIDNRITGITEDSDGNIWISHRDAGRGITKYDGTSWIWYTIWMEGTGLPSNDIYTSAADPEGGMWFATAKGLVNYHNNTWTTYTTDNGLESHNINEIYIDDQGNIWAIYNRYEQKGVSRLSNGVWETFTKKDGLINDGITSLIRDSYGSIYYGSTEGITINTNGSWTHHPENNRLASSTIYDIDRDSKGNMWFASTKGLARFDGQEWTSFMVGNPGYDDMIQVESSSDESIWTLSSFGRLAQFVNGDFSKIPLEHFSIPESDNRITAISVDPSGKVWAVTDAKPVYNQEDNTWLRYLWVFDGQAWKHYPMTFDVPIEHTPSLDIDEQGAVWIASDFGLIRLLGGEVTRFSVEGPISNYIRDITVDGFNGKAIATDRGISFYDGEWRSLPDESRRTIEYDSQNVLWLSGYEGVTRLIGDQLVLDETMNGENFYQTISYKLDADNVMWIGTVWGLWKYANDEWSYYGEDFGGIIDGIKDMAMDKNGLLWLTTGIDNSVWSFDGAEFKQYTSRDGLAYDRTSQVVVDNDNVKWIGTLKGLSSYNDTTWTTYTTADGLPHDNIRTLAVDNNNVLWVGTQNGAAGFDGETWKTYTEEDGLVDNLVLTIEVDKNNVKWFGTAHGLSSFDSRTSNVTTKLPPAIQLYGNYPNPFNIFTTIDFDLVSWGTVTLDIYNIAGQKVRSFDFPALSAGRKQVVWDGRNNDGSTVSSGAYFYRITRGTHTSDGRMMLVK